MNHKKQLDTYVEQMITAAKKKGGGKDLTGDLRLVTAGDKFLSQVDLTIALGNGQQDAGKKAMVQRYNINEGAIETKDAKGNTVDVKHSQGPGQLHYWTVANDKAVGDFVATKHMVELKASGKDSLTSDARQNSTQFDVGKAVEELVRWKADVTTKRDLAQNALGIGVAAGKSA
jgi:hypothetical protein